MKTVVTIQKNEPNLQEWLTYHLDVCGFDTVTFFNDGDRITDLDNRVHQIMVKDVYPEDHPLPKQMFCYNKFMYSHARLEYTHFAVLDSDEYLFLGDQSVGEFLDGRDGDVQLNWCFFTSEEERGVPKESFAHRFLHRKVYTDIHTKGIYAIGQNFPMWADVQAAFINPHFLTSMTQRRYLPWRNVFGEESRGPFNYHVYDAATQLFIAHYYTRTPEEYAAKRRRGRPDCHPNDPHQFNDAFMDDELEKLYAERSVGEVFDGRISAKLKLLETA